jgi:hypothetical protein
MGYKDNQNELEGQSIIVREKLNAAKEKNLPIFA